MADNAEVEEFLAHYGVLGMKWGVRRTQAQLDRAAGRKSKKSSRASKKQTKAAERKPSSDYQDFSKNLQKKSFEFSNDELRKFNERLQLERSYKELKTNRGFLNSLKIGTAAVGTVLAVGTLANTAVTVVKGPAGQAIAKMLIKK